MPTEDRTIPLSDVRGALETADQIVRVERAGGDPVVADCMQNLLDVIRDGITTDAR